MDGSTTGLISQEDLNKVAEITRLHDEAFWHYHKYDGHAKSSDGFLGLEIRFGTVWERADGPVSPTISVNMYSYVVASETPSYPNFGDRNHYFETIDEALNVMREWHAKAMAYQPTEEELKEMDDFASEMWDVIKDKVTIIDVTKEEDNG